MRRDRWVMMLTLAATLGGCASMREVTLDVRDGDDAARGALVRAIPLNEGFVPLPLNDDTIAEILLLEKKSQQAVVSEGGVARLRLRAGVPHVVEVEPARWREGGVEREQERWLLDADGRTIERADGGGQYEVRVSR